MPNATHKVEDTARDIENHPIANWLAAAGHVANGIVHAVIGLIAIGIARGSGGSADQSGAMEAIRSTPVGGIALWFVGITLLALALYQLAEAIGNIRREIKDAVKGFGKMVAYIAVGTIALIYATGGSSEGNTEQAISAQLLSSGWGRVVLAIVGVVAVGIGVAMIYRGVTKKFLEDIEVPSRSLKWFSILGMTGYIAKGLAVAAVGFLFLVAVWNNDASEAGGMDDGLNAFTELPFGQVVLIAIGAGLITYGIFCLAKAITARPK